MTVRPGAYLRDMREAAGLSIDDVATLLAMLQLNRRGQPWARLDVRIALHEIEAGLRAATDAQLLSLGLVFPLHLLRYRELRSNARGALIDAIGATLERMRSESMTPRAILLGAADLVLIDGQRDLAGIDIRPITGRGGSCVYSNRGVARAVRTTS